MPGFGLEATLDGHRVRLGSRRWTGVDDAPAATGPELWLARADAPAVRFAFADTLRPDAKETAQTLAASYDLRLLSGDTEATTAAIAGELGLAQWAAEQTPADKIARIEQAADDGATVLMVGDGLNDAPALKAAHVSMSPASAADISQTAADFVFQGERLAPVEQTVDTARKARALVFQNFGLALAYNLVAVPLAVSGYVTPLIAAIAMSASSLTVTLNALRLGLKDAK
jgi:Cu2+-exporting ATPase